MGRVVGLPVVFHYGEGVTDERVKSAVKLNRMYLDEI